MRKILPMLAAVAVLTAGCSLVYPVDGYEVGGEDAGTRDAGRVDAGGARDAGPDSGPTDAGPADAGPPDAGPPDAGPPARCTDVAHGCDLTIGCSMPDAVPGSGSSLRVPFTVSNLGTLSGAGPFDVAVEMDRNGTFERVGTEAFPGILMPLGTATGEVAFVVPDWVVPGENTLRCIVDVDDEVPETAEDNNEDGSSFVATGRPDLRPASVSIPGSPGNPFPVSFDVVNSGPTAAYAVPWLISGGDSSGGGTLRSGTLPVVRAGESIRLMESITVPFPLSGSGMVLVRIDPGDTIMESNESNNDFVRSVTW